MFDSQFTILKSPGGTAARISQSVTLQYSIFDVHILNV